MRFPRSCCHFWSYRGGRIVFPGSGRRADAANVAIVDLHRRSGWSGQRSPVYVVRSDSQRFGETLVLASGVAKIVFRADFVAVATIAADWTSSRWEHVDGNRTQAHEKRAMHHFKDGHRKWFEGSSWFVVRNVATDRHLEGENLPIHREEELISSISVPFPLPLGQCGFLMIGFREERQIGEEDIRFVRSMAQTIAATL